MEFEILYAIQDLHREWLTPIMYFFTTVGEAGICWIIVSIVLALIPKTRKCGLTMMLSMAITFVLGNLVLKNLIARPRPCAIDKTVELLIPFPKEYSFPSGHSANGFSASVVILMYHRIPGIIAILCACIIAFSRMYFFVHYPTDILGGMALGTIDALISMAIVKKLANKRV